MRPVWIARRSDRSRFLWTRPAPAPDHQLVPRDPRPEDNPVTAGNAPVLSRDGEIRPGYWDPTASGRHLISRPISIDGLLADRARIELTPRIVQRGAAFLDDSYNAVDVVARQLASVFTLEQLVLATVALRVHMRIGRERMRHKKALQEKWTALAHRLMKLRGEERHVSVREQRIVEERANLAAEENSRPGGAELLAIEEAEVVQARQAWKDENRQAWEEWARLEDEETALLAGAPQLEQTEDLRQPYILLLVAARRDVARSVAAAMHTLVDALQKPLSRTDQMLLEIAFRRCIRAASPEGEREVERWEAALIHAAEKEFAAEFPWSVPYLASA
jgi:hypothetical protein